MVVNVYVEGGIINGNVVIKKCSGYKEAAKEFIAANVEQENYLYVDLDRKPELRNEWFKSLSDDGIEMPAEKTDHVSFWIQEMEAWFLKQPEAIELWTEEENLTRKAGQESTPGQIPYVNTKVAEISLNLPTFKFFGGDPSRK